jgi:hypothetical protein
VGDTLYFYGYVGHNDDEKGALSLPHASLSPSSFSPVSLPFVFGIICCKVTVDKENVAGHGTARKQDGILGHSFMAGCSPWHGCCLGASSIADSSRRWIFSIINNGSYDQT